MGIKKAKLGRLLLDSGLVGERELSAALCYQKNQRCLLGASLVKLGFLSEDRLLDFLERTLQLERVDLDSFIPDATTLAMVPEERALAFTVFPLDRCHSHGGPVLRMAMADPSNLTVIDALEFMTGLGIQPVLASEPAIHRAIERGYRQDVGLALVREGGSRKESNDKTMVSVAKFNKLVEILQAKGLLNAADVELLDKE
jgi:type IV pilus assembly protein PilB